MSSLAPSKRFNIPMQSDPSANDVEFEMRRIGCIQRDSEHENVFVQKIEGRSPTKVLRDQPTSENIALQDSDVFIQPTEERRGMKKVLTIENFPHESEVEYDVDGNGVDFLADGRSCFKLILETCLGMDHWSYQNWKIGITSHRNGRQLYLRRVMEHEYTTAGHGEKFKHVMTDRNDVFEESEFKDNTIDLNEHWSAVLEMTVGGHKILMCSKIDCCDPQNSACWIELKSVSKRALRNQVCYDYVNRRCQYGDRCKFLHLTNDHQVNEYHLLSARTAKHYWAQATLADCSEVMVGVHCDKNLQEFLKLQTKEIPRKSLPPFSANQHFKFLADVLDWLKVHCEPDKQYLLSKSEGETFLRLEEETNDVVWA